MGKSGICWNASSIREVFGEEEYEDLLCMAEMSVEELQNELDKLSQRETDNAPFTYCPYCGQKRKRKE